MNPGKRSLHDKAIELITNNHVMTIATCSEKTPWSAPVYYAFYNASFYFLSSPKSRHITDALNLKTVAVSIHTLSKGWIDIKGLQMEGTLSLAGITQKSTTAFISYLKKFPFISDIKQRAITDITSLERLFDVKWYAFIPESVYYLDNSIHFGYRETVSL